MTLQVFGLLLNRPTNPALETSKTRQTIPPLLGGEGQGEGERQTNLIHALLTGTPLENHGYEYFGERAYERWIQRD